MGKAGAIAYVETQFQLDLLNHYDPKQQIPAVVCTPALEYALLNTQRRSLRPNAVFSDSDAYEASRQTYALTRSLCEEIDRTTCEVFGYTGPVERISTISLFYYMKMFVDHMKVRSSQILSLLEQGGYDTLMVLPSEEVKPEFSIHPYKRGTTSAIAPIMARRLGMEIVQVAPALPAPEYPPQKIIARPEAAPKAVSPCLLIDEKSYESGPVPERWKQETGGDVVNIAEVMKLAAPTAAHFEKGRQLLEALRRNPAVQALCTWQGGSLMEVADPLLACLALSYIPRQVALSETTKAFSAFAPCAMLVSSMGVCVHENARAAGMKSFVYQHGGCAVRENPLLDYVWRFDADYLLSYGPGTSSYFKSWDHGNNIVCGDTVAMPHSVGAQQLRELERKKLSGREQYGLMFISTMQAGDMIFYSHHFSDFWYWDFKRKLVSVLSEKECECAVKVHPHESADAPLKPFMEEQSIDNCEIVAAPLVDCLDKAEAFAVDSFSTCILQLCLTTKPILALAMEEFFRFNPEALELLERRVELCRSEEEFLNRLKSFPEEETFNPDRLHNREFLEAYGLGEDDPTEAAIRFIQKTLSDVGRKPVEQGRI
ncbi:MAG: hypothetical protein ACNI3A_02510 [Desulfovibrio sp.]|uniref:hypothetical protein n=1 Tax=Desulfovibrio sp. 7SRBS1 TaxID=3378064 RepID=UPI003B3D9AF0